MKKYIVPVILLALLLPASSAFAVWGPIYADAYAEVWSPAGTSVSASHQTVYGWRTATAHASATRTDASTQAWANASAGLSWQGLNSWTNGGKIVAQGDAAAWSSSQGYNFVISIGGLIGGWVTGSVNFNSILLTVPATTTLDLNRVTGVDLALDVDGAPVGAGQFQLFSNGSYSGTGWYADSFFDVFYDAGTNCWKALYTGPSSRDVVMPLGQDFQLNLNDGSHGTFAGMGSDDGTYHEVSLMLPQGYEFNLPVPEPGSFLVLAMGLAGISGMLVRRRR